jgi:hypothetical protein
MGALTLTTCLSADPTTLSSKTAIYLLAPACRGHSLRSHPSPVRLYLGRLRNHPSILPVANYHAPLTTSRDRLAGRAPDLLLTSGLHMMLAHDRPPRRVSTCVRPLIVNLLVWTTMTAQTQAMPMRPCIPLLAWPAKIFGDLATSRATLHPLTHTPSSIYPAADQLIDARSVLKISSKARSRGISHLNTKNGHPPQNLHLGPWSRLESVRTLRLRVTLHSIMGRHRLRPATARSALESQVRPTSLRKSTAMLVWSFMRLASCSSQPTICVSLHELAFQRPCFGTVFVVGMVGACVRIRQKPCNGSAVP